MGTTRSRYGGAATFGGVVARTTPKKLRKLLPLLVDAPPGDGPIIEHLPHGQNGGSRALAAPPTSSRRVSRAMLSSSIQPTISGRILTSPRSAATASAWSSTRTSTP